MLGEQGVNSCTHELASTSYRFSFDDGVFDNMMALQDADGHFSADAMEGLRYMVAAGDAAAAAEEARLGLWLSGRVGLVEPRLHCLVIGA